MEELNLLLVVAGTIGSVVLIMLVWVLLRPSWMGFAGRSMWDWLSILAMPLTVGVAGLALNEGQFQREVARNSAIAFRDYVDRISALALSDAMLERPDDVSAVAMAHTRTILTSADSAQAARVLAFLAELGRLEDFAPGFEGQNLHGVDLKGLDLRRVDFEGAILTKADLEDADLRRADLEEADLSGADLKGADLRDVDFEGAILSGTSFAGARLEGVDLSDSIGLNAAQLDHACTDSRTRLPDNLILMRKPDCADTADDHDDD